MTRFTLQANPLMSVKLDTLNTSTVMFTRIDLSATTSVPLGSPLGPNGTPKTPSSRLESLKHWTVSTYKCSRQSIFERLGKTTRTVDSELECQIEALRDTQRKYSNILRLARALTSHFYHVVQTQVIKKLQILTAMSFYSFL